MSWKKALEGTHRPDRVMREIEVFVTDSHRPRAGWEFTVEVIPSDFEKRLDTLRAEFHSKLDHLLDQMFAPFMPPAKDP